MDKPTQDPQECKHLAKEFITLEDYVRFRCDKFDKYITEYRCSHCPDFTPKTKKK